MTKSTAKGLDDPDGREGGVGGEVKVDAPPSGVPGQDAGGHKVDLADGDEGLQVRRGGGEGGGRGTGGGQQGLEDLTGAGKVLEWEWKHRFWRTRQ